MKEGTKMSLFLLMAIGMMAIVGFAIAQKNNETVRNYFGPFLVIFLPLLVWKFFGQTELGNEGTEVMIWSMLFAMLFGVMIWYFLESTDTIPDNRNITPRRFLFYLIVAMIFGAIGEYMLGASWHYMFGEPLWIYPDSPLIYTSFQSIPFWGIALLSFLFIIRQIEKREKDFNRAKKSALKRLW
jgi:hypothetical protein